MPLFSLPFLMGPAVLLLIPLTPILLLPSPVLAPLALILNAPWVDTTRITEWLGDLGVWDWIAATFNFTV